MDIFAAYLAGVLTPLVIINGWYAVIRMRRGWRESKTLRRVA